jgi:hypothetical protein
MRLLFLLAVAALSGCMALKSPEQLAVESDDALVWDYGFQPSAAVRAELERRGTFTDAEWSLIRGRHVQIGAREIVLYAAWGPPHHTDTITTRWGVERTHYYGSDEHPTIVVVSNGLITSMGRF